MSLCSISKKKDEFDVTCEAVECEVRPRQYRRFMCDFETTVYDGQEFTEVWAAACVELYTEDVSVFGSIDELWDYFKSLNTNVIAYFHNLKFDGAFILSFFLTKLGMAQAIDKTKENPAWVNVNDMRNNTFQYCISSMGAWYKIVAKVKGKYIEFRDSLKLLPFSVKQIGKSFGTKHKKLDMKYEGFRYAGCEITPEERRYIENDVLVVKEALEMMLDDGHSKLTIGSCCMDEFKRGFSKEDYEYLFPNVYEILIDENLYGQPTAGHYIHKAYHGGWCYLVRGKEGRHVNGTTADVNSLYPSMMHSESGNRYPVGMPTFWKGNYIPDAALHSTSYYFVRVRTKFRVKEGKLPCIQIKGNPLYRGTDWLDTSDVYDRRTQRYYDRYVGLDGQVKEAVVEMTLTMTDYALIKEHYDLECFEILDGCWFDSLEGIFDKYIDKYKKIKMESKGAVRTEAKLFLNNLYGKLAASMDSSFKLAYVKEDESLGYIQVSEHDKEPGYIPCGCAITSYARNFTIRAAQKNYHGLDKPGFVYADTDSIHCDIPADEIKGIRVDENDFCCWKLESSWDEALFVRQKTYAEHVVAQDLNPCDPYWDVKCAGMPERCKNLFLMSMGHGVVEDLRPLEQEFVSVKRTIDDFKVGLSVPGKLRPVNIPGGIVLKDVPFVVRENIGRAR